MARTGQGLGGLTSVGVVGERVTGYERLKAILCVVDSTGCGRKGVGEKEKKRGLWAVEGEGGFMREEFFSFFFLSFASSTFAGNGAGRWRGGGAVAYNLSSVGV